MLFMHLCKQHDGYIEQNFRHFPLQLIQMPQAHKNCTLICHVTSSFMVSTKGKMLVDLHIINFS